MKTVLGIWDSSVTSVSCPKMGNSGDCGMFTIEYLRAYLLVMFPMLCVTTHAF